MTPASASLRLTLAVIIALSVAPGAEAKPQRTEAEPKQCAPIERVWYFLTFRLNKCQSAEDLAAPPPPPPPSPPPPPPPPPVVQCAPGPYVIFFEWDRSDITTDAATILDNAVSAYANCGTAQVMLAGHADKSGTPKYNLDLSERRSSSVRAYLTSKGIPGAVITAHAFGETRPRVETDDGVREAENRRVEITYGPTSGT